MSDFLEDAREERFCEYIGSMGCQHHDAYQKAFRIDCGLSEFDYCHLSPAANRLFEKDYIQERIKQIKGLTAGAGKLTKELVMLQMEQRLQRVLLSKGCTGKDELNMVRTAIALTDALGKMKGWGSDAKGNSVSVTMNRVFPKGFKGDKADEVLEEKTTVSIDFSKKEEVDSVSDLGSSSEVESVESVSLKNLVLGPKRRGGRPRKNG